MDFGFVRVLEYKIKQENKRRTTIIDGYNSYLIIVDREIHYILIFLA